VFSESPRSEAVGMTRDVVLISVGIRPFSCPVKHSKCKVYFWVSGKMEYGVWSKMYIICFRNVVKKVKYRYPQKILK
jgi:hypothetical protein